MSPRRIAVVVVSGALLAGGTGAAIAAVTSDDAKQAEQAILDDAAKRLEVTPEKLRDALSAARDAQLDRAVKDGKLTQQQADAIKQRRQQSGRVLGGGSVGAKRGGKRGGHGGRGAGFGFGTRGGLFGADLAKALGITREQLHEQLRARKSVAEIAEAQGKSLSDVRTALKADAKRRLDEAVADGKLTQERADRLRAGVNEGIDRIGEARSVRPRSHRRGGKPRVRPGSFAPSGGVVPGRQS